MTGSRVRDAQVEVADGDEHDLRSEATAISSHAKPLLRDPTPHRPGPWRGMFMSWARERIAASLRPNFCATTDGCMNASWRSRVSSATVHCL